MCPKLFVLVLPVFLLVPPADADDSEWSAIKVRFGELWADPDPARKIEAVGLLGEADSPEAVRLLLKTLRYRNPGLAAQRRARAALLAELAGKPPLKTRVDLLRKLAALDVQIASGAELRARATTSLASTRNADALSVLRVASLGGSHADVRAAAVTALGRIGSVTALPHIRKLIVDRDPLVRAAAIAAAVRLRDSKAMPRIIAALDDDVWQVRLAAVRATSAMRPLDAVGALIGRLPHEGRLRGEIDRALERITALRLGGGPGDWATWYASHKDGLAEAIARRRKGAGEAAANRTVSLPARQAVLSRRIVFVIDASARMAGPLPDARGDLTASAPQGKHGKPDPQPRAKQRAGPTTMFDLARRWLIQTIRSLPPEARFNVIVAGTRPRALAQGRLVRPERKPRLVTIAWLGQLVPGGPANLVDAIDCALRVCDPPTRVDHRRGPDTIVLVTDGMAIGRLRRNPPHRARMFRELGLRNASRMVRIDVRVIAERPMVYEPALRQLATGSGGKIRTLGARHLTRK